MGSVNHNQKLRCVCGKFGAPYTHAGVCTAKTGDTPPTRTFAPSTPSTPPSATSTLSATVSSAYDRYEQFTEPGTAECEECGDFLEPGRAQAGWTVCEDCADAFSAEETPPAEWEHQWKPGDRPLYHGTPAVLHPGDIIVPAVKRAQQSHWGTSGNVHAASCTENFDTAEYFGAVAARGKPHLVYEVVPVNPGETMIGRNLQTDPDEEPSIEYLSEEGFLVVRAVQR